MRLTCFHAAFLMLSVMLWCSQSPAQGRGRGVHGRAPNAHAEQGQAHAENAGHGNGQGAAHANAGEGQSQAAAHRPALPPQAQAHAGAGEGATAGGSSAQVHGPAQRPAGWDKGNKTGWGDCNVPPGLEAGSGCGASLADIARAERAKHASSGTNHAQTSDGGPKAATPARSEAHPRSGSASQPSPKKGKEPNAGPDRD